MPKCRQQLFQLFVYNQSFPFPSITFYVLVCVCVYMHMQVYNVTIIIYVNYLRYKSRLNLNKQSNRIEHILRMAVIYYNCLKTQ